MSAFALNPELLRNARIQLRPGRAVAAAVICAAVSLTAWSSYHYGSVTGPGDSHDLVLFRITLLLQVIVLLLGGGIACLQSVHREKELNTFDFQRVTRLSSFELGIGKLFGAPILAYFVVLCLMPLAIFAAVIGHIGVWPFVQAYVIVLFGCIVYHAFAVLASTMLGRGGSAMAILLFLLLVGITSADTGPIPTDWQLKEFGPFAARYAASWDWGKTPFDDQFFGLLLPHFAVLFVLFAIFTAWFLLGIVRNLKRDPAVYEIYSPMQAFFFALYLELLVLGFFRWKSPGLMKPPGVVINWSYIKEPPLLPAVETEHALLFLSAWIFFGLGMLLLRNRERVRRRVRAMGDVAAGWWASLWPALYVIGGIILTGLAVVELIRIYRQPIEGWSIASALFEVAFCGVWIARDVLYLQWMNLRRTRRPLVFAFLYLIIFYVCAGILLGALAAVMSERAVALSALLVPSQLLPRIVNMWPTDQPLLIGILAGLAVEALGFAFLQRQKLREFITPPVVAPVMTPRKPSLMTR
ncbi:MAG: hypothetical protein ABSF40_17700 [Candidatus Acidiferrales bacterium]